MAEKILNARVTQKHDTAENWLASNFIPLSGEIIIYDFDDQKSKMKIGNGIDTANDLPFLFEEKGVTSWNDLEDKPFSSEAILCEWDATKTYPEKISGNPMTNEKISDTPLSEDYSVLLGQTVNYIGYNNETVISQIITEDSIVEIEPGVYQIYYFTSATHDVKINDTLTLTRGIWHYDLRSSVPNIKTAQIIGVGKQLDEKYIPNTIARVSDIPTIEGLATEEYVTAAIEAIPAPDFDNLELITTADIDTIWGTTIQVATASEVTF